jgi:hypothetical protein
MKTLDALIKTNDSITAVINGEPKTMSASHPSFREAINAITNNDIELLDVLFNVSGRIKNKFNTTSKFASIEICDGEIFYCGEKLHNYVVDRILAFMQESLPFQPLVNFLEKLMENPSKRAVDELYRFLEHKHLPICEDGDFLAYKSVRNDYKDHHTGKFDNRVGQVLSMPRNAVCDNAEVGCSDGFHAGSYEYAKSFGGDGSRLVIVKINPADVVSVPHDCECQKLRTSRYVVVKDFEHLYHNPLNTEFKSKVSNNFHSLRDSRGRFRRA